MTLVLRRQQVDEIRQHGARAYPNECCGALLGVGGESGEKIVRVLVPLDNRREGEAARTRFLLAADDYRTAERAAREQRLEIVGFYHSHPDHPAKPSAYDQEHAWPWYSYVVVRVARGAPQEITSWVLADDRSHFLPEEIGTTDEHSAAAPQPKSERVVETTDEHR
jgi:proteasome lid subunit RPN8/RPN11